MIDWLAEIEAAWAGEYFYLEMNYGEAFRHIKRLIAEVRRLREAAPLNDVLEALREATAELRRLREAEAVHVPCPVCITAEPATLRQISDTLREIADSMPWVSASHGKLDRSEDVPTYARSHTVVYKPLGDE